MRTCLFFRGLLASTGSLYGDLRVPVEQAVERRLLLVLVGSKKLEVRPWGLNLGWTAMSLQARFGNKSLLYSSVMIFQPFFSQSLHYFLGLHHTQ